MTNAEAIEETLAILEQQGLLRDIDAATIQALRSMADCLDVRPGNSQMWKEYRQAIKELVGDERNGGEIDKLLAALRGPVRDPKKT